MNLTKVVATILLVVSILLIRSVFKIKGGGREDLMVEKIRTFGAAILLLIMAYGFYMTDKTLCELTPILCR